MSDEAKEFVEVIKQGVETLAAMDVLPKCECGDDWSRSCPACTPQRLANVVRRYEQRMAKQPRELRYVKEAPVQEPRRWNMRRLDNARRMYNAKYKKSLTLRQFQMLMVDMGKQIKDVK